ncbi:MAG: 3-isopropylmalate dehydratase small subunit [Gammaproteobacteria bacterium]|tara:strand:- start:652 stop:1299 length:648 start_codon:yes stop_codon:yes gene_type:complete
MKLQGNELQINGIIASIDRDNIDTDQIIPTEYLKSIKKFGFEDYLFDGWRYLDDGKLGVTKDQRQINEKFVLNISPYDKATILLTRDNFGCGSSREHAVWALRDFGIKAVIASSFGDIFYNNCFKNGVLPIQLSKEQIEDLFKLSQDTIKEISVSLDAKKLSIGDIEYKFSVEDNLLERIIYGLDDVDITLQDKELIKDFESNRIKNKPWIFAND